MYVGDQAAGRWCTFLATLRTGGLVASTKPRAAHVPSRFYTVHTYIRLNADGLAHSRYSGCQHELVSIPCPAHLISLLDDSKISQAPAAITTYSVSAIMVCFQHQRRGGFNFFKDCELGSGSRGAYY
jgi:hypothetical protein